MGALWPIIEPLLVHYVLPDVLDMLVQAGIMSAAKATGIEDIADLKLFIDNLKFIYTYPDDPPATMTPNNLSQQEVK